MYTTFVSEFMLQQTTVSTVMAHYKRFCSIYPSLFHLASSSEEMVCREWKGLGYYRRARNLFKAAVSIVKNHEEIPLDYRQLVEIDGIGEYTANALLSIGADRPLLALDANLERVLSRIYLLSESSGSKLKKNIQFLFNEKKIAQDIYRWGGRAFNEALMDLGRTFCKSHQVYCTQCPLQNNCLARKHNPLDYPLNRKKTTKIFELDLLRIIVQKKDKILAYRKKENEWLSGQLELPTFIIQSEDRSLEQYPVWKKNIDIDQLPSITTSITKYKIRNHILKTYKKSFKELSHFRFFPLDFHNEHYSTTTVKIFKKLK